MARLRRAQEPVSNDRWVVSYADFITILLAFFVVMYSISSVNEGKYRVLSNSLGSAFGSSKTTADLQRVILEPPTKADRESLSASAPIIPFMLKHKRNTPTTPPAEQSAAKRDDSFSQETLDQAEREIDGIATSVEHEMSELIDDDIINIKRNKFWLEIEVKTSLLFTSGSSDLIPESLGVLVKLSDIFSNLPNRVHVEGFTDDRPIRTIIFPSNWELSAARAAAVVRLFDRNGVDPSRMASIGYGQYHPIADNTSEEGRARNRRVVIVVMAALDGDGSERIYEFELLKGQAR